MKNNNQEDIIKNFNNNNFCIALELASKCKDKIIEEFAILLRFINDTTNEFKDLANHSISLCKNETPDFVVKLDSKEIGIEISKATKKGVEQALSIRNSNEKLRDIAMASDFNADNSMNEKQIKKELCNNKDRPTGYAYSGSDVEEEAVTIISDVICKKK